jgi:uncharacterized protein (UPF0332 family)
MRRASHSTCRRLKRPWNWAQELYDKQHVRTAVSRSYYAMFYAATALLAAKGLAFSKH